jgi:hypothetical protein
MGKTENFLFHPPATPVISLIIGHLGVFPNSFFADNSLAQPFRSGQKCNAERSPFAGRILSNRPATPD